MRITYKSKAQRWGMLKTEAVSFDRLPWSVVSIPVFTYHWLSEWGFWAFGAQTGQKHLCHLSMRLTKTIASHSADLLKGVNMITFRSSELPEWRKNCIYNGHTILKSQSKIFQSVARYFREPKNNILHPKPKRHYEAALLRSTFLPEGICCPMFKSIKHPAIAKNFKQ